MWKRILLYEFKKLLPDCEIKGLDISSYAIENGKPEIKNSLTEVMLIIYHLKIIILISFFH